jgi:hypothetical protein
MWVSVSALPLLLPFEVLKVKNLFTALEKLKNLSFSRRRL